MQLIDFAQHTEIVKLSDELGISQAEAAAILKSPMVRDASLWGNPIQSGGDEELQSVDLIKAAGGGLLCELVEMICESVQFPRSTAYLHALGCVASATTKGFKFDYYGGDKPLNLYCVSAQPPSTGKSMVNEVMTTPIALAYQSINKRNAAITSDLQSEIDELLKSKPQKESEQHKRLTECYELIESTHIYKYTLTDATIEAAEAVAGKQGGMFNVLSAEADSINTLLGLAYSDGGNAKANHGLILQGWDGEMYSSSRITRTGYTGFIRGSISVIAQDSSVDSILSTSELGRGTPERFLMIREPDLLGSRVYDEYKPMNREIIAKYDNLIFNIINENEIKLKMDADCYKKIMTLKSVIEPDLAAGGKYSSALMRGFMGKADKHILKIAYVIFVSEHWHNEQSKKYKMSVSYVNRAIKIFDEISRTYIKSADSLGYVGENSNIEKMKDIFTKMAEKGRLKTSFESLRANYRKTKPFSGIPKFGIALKDKIIPALIDDNYCVVSGNDIHINPRLK